MDIFPYKEPELMIRACFFLGLRFLFGYVSISSAYAVNVSYVTSSIKSSSIIQGTERKERQQTNPIHRDLRISKETIGNYVYNICLYYILPWHLISQYIFQSFQVVQIVVKFSDLPQDTCKSTAAAAVVSTQGFKDLAQALGEVPRCPKIRDSSLKGWRYVFQGTGNQWVQHCQESWLALVPGLRFQLGHCGLRYGDHGITPNLLCRCTRSKKPASKPDQLSPKYRNSQGGYSIATEGLDLLLRSLNGHLIYRDVKLLHFQVADWWQ